MTWRYPICKNWFCFDIRHVSHHEILLKRFHSDIQDGRHGGHLEILQTILPPEPNVTLSLNLMGGIRGAEILSHSDIQVAILKFFKQHLLPKVG